LIVLTWQQFSVSVLCAGGVGVKQVAFLQGVWNHTECCSGENRHGYRWWDFNSCTLSGWTPDRL